MHLPCGVTHRNTGEPQQQLAQLQLLRARAVANQQLRLRVNKARRQLMAEARLAAVLAGRSAGRSLWCWWEQLPNMLNIIYLLLFIIYQGIRDNALMQQPPVCMKSCALALG